MTAICAIMTLESDAAKPACAVQATGLGKSIDEKPILADLSFEIPEGRYTALLGANGAGKSTLLKLLGALLEPTAGTLAIFGAPHSRDAAALRARIGMIGHGAMLYRELSALENLVFFGRLYRVPDPAGRARTLLAEVGLADRAHDSVKTFSRGMVQRVAIARALVHDPALLLADEPFAGLDAPSRASLEAALSDLRDQGKTIILANHDIKQSLELADHALVLRKGRLVVDRATAELDAEGVLAEVTGP
ncbi:MAG: ABC transporter ATP-binding protein [Planctomycetota bacterium]|jgi:ABC-type multidrug transport system ATPase subunit